MLQFNTQQSLLNKRDASSFPEKAILVYFDIFCKVDLSRIALEQLEISTMYSKLQILRAYKLQKVFYLFQFDINGYFIIQLNNRMNKLESNIGKFSQDFE